MPVTSADGEARFDTDSSDVKALKYISSGTSLKEETIILSGALTSAQATLSLVAGILALSFN